MNPEHLNQWLGNTIAVGAVISTIMGWAPAVAAVVALIWYLIQIYESPTVQRWLATRRTRKIARMKAQVLLMEAQNKRALPGPEEGGMGL